MTPETNTPQSPETPVAADGAVVLWDATLLGLYLRELAERRRAKVH